MGARLAPRGHRIRGGGSLFIPRWPYRLLGMLQTHPYKQCPARAAVAREALALTDAECEVTVYKLRQLCPCDFDTASKFGLLGREGLGQIWRVGWAEGTSLVLEDPPLSNSGPPHLEGGALGRVGFGPSQHSGAP